MLELEQGKFRLDDVYFADETELVYGLAPRFGYSAKPLFAAEAHKTRGSGKVFIHAIISRRGVVKLWLTQQSGDDKIVCSFMLDDHDVPADAPETGGTRVFSRLPRGAILIFLPALVAATTLLVSAAFAMRLRAGDCAAAGKGCG